MFDIGGSELLVIGVVALIVVGPKDLPGMFHAIGRFTAKARSMAREFSRAMEDAAKDSGVGDVAKDLKGITSPKSLGLDKVQQAAAKFEAWDPLKKQPAKPASALKTAGPATEALAKEREADKAKAAEDAAARKAARAEAAEDAADIAEAPAPVPAAATPAATAPAKTPAKPRAKAAKPAAETKAEPAAAKPAKAKAKAAPKKTATASGDAAPKPRKPRAKKSDT